MFRHLYSIDYLKQFVERATWILSIVLLLPQLTGCSLSPGKVSLSQEELQQAIRVGFLAPQIRTFDFQPLMVVQVYLDAPSVHINGDADSHIKGNSERVSFVMKGKLYAEIFGGQVIEALPITILGGAGLTYNVDERAVYLNKITLYDTLVDLDVALFRAMILSKFQSALAKELADIPLISLSQTPELEERVVKLAEEGSITIKGEDGYFVFQHTAP